MRRPAPRADLGRVTLDQRKADPAVVQEDAGRTGYQVRPEIESIGLGERDAETAGVDGTQVGGVAVTDVSVGGAATTG